MTGSRAAILWAVAAVAALAGGLMSEPMRPLGVVAAALFFVLAIVSFRKGRQPPSRDT